MKAASHAVSIVALERGASWPAWVRGACHRRATDAVIEAQGEFELPAVFAQRVQKKLRELTERGATVRLAVIVTSGDGSASAEEMRRTLAKSALSAMGSKVEGELMLALEPGDKVVDDARHRLLALAGGLCEELRNYNVTLSVKFAGSLQQSGYLPALHAARPTPLDYASSGGD